MLLTCVESCLVLLGGVLNLISSMAGSVLHLTGRQVGRERDSMQGQTCRLEKVAQQCSMSIKGHLSPLTLPATCEALSPTLCAAPLMERPAESKAPDTPWPALEADDEASSAASCRDEEGGVGVTVAGSVGVLMVVLWCSLYCVGIMSAALAVTGQLNPAVTAAVDALHLQPLGET